MRLQIILFNILTIPFWFPLLLARCLSDTLELLGGTKIWWLSK